MRAVGFRRQGITLDVALRYRAAWSLEHYSLDDRLTYASKERTKFVEGRLQVGLYHSDQYAKGNPLRVLVLRTQRLWRLVEHCDFNQATTY